ncbi:hypothetical protein M9H77_30588 [Catharanthus roseus]|uniref:Uncharacterized protein n=1 Tax=Catharanthus roseus TaxID=4058 RepID=A0ACC0A1L0_CATRO|nr:hypothetical protein M9H77_30588 [Catharanthus roseus]
MSNASIQSIVVGFGLDGALFDILHDQYLRKFVENVGYVSSFLDTFIENHNDFVFLINLFWLISKTAFEEKSFHGLAIFYRKYIKDFSTIASSLMDVPEKKTRFSWQNCLHFNAIASNQVPYSTTLYFSLEVDYGYVLCLEEKTNMKLIKYIHSKNQDIVHANNKKFRMKQFAFHLRGLGWGHFGFD